MVAVDELENEAPVGAGSDEVLWADRPSLRTLIPAAIVAGAVAWYGYMHVGWLFQQFLDATAETLPWTEGAITLIWRLLQAACFVPAAVVLGKAVARLATRYRLTGDRLLFSRGILLRRHDQIALQRVRDYRVLQPLAARLTGTGKLVILSRDETLPEFVMGPFADPHRAEHMIREGVAARQKETGHREFESY